MIDRLDDKLRQIHQRFGQCHDRLRQELMASLPSEAPVRQWPRWRGVRRVLIGETRMSRLARLSIASAAGTVAAIIIIATAGAPRVAFGEVMAKFAAVQTVHLKRTRNGDTDEIWLRRPNQIRVQHADGTYEISAGPDQWVVDPQANTAVRKPSRYYQDAQRQGLDVVDVALQSPFEQLSPLFSEKPAERIRQDGRELDVYRLVDADMGIRAEAKVDAKTHLLASLEVTLDEGRTVKLPGRRPGAARRRQSRSWQVLGYDVPMADDLFVFKAAEGMTVAVEPAPSHPLPQTTPAPKAGSTLSGRVVWANSGQPVPGAGIMLKAGRFIQGPNNLWKQEFSARVRTDAAGIWRVEGVPAGAVAFMWVRIGEINWPAMPAFEGNVGSYERPRLWVDGQRAYENVDFKAYRPQDLYARITVTVRDEDGRPIEGVGASLSSEASSSSLSAAPGKRFSDADGKLDDKTIWPTRTPVILSVYPRDAGKPDDPYASYVAHSKSFTVEPAKHYEFEFTLPQQRQMMLNIVGTTGKCLEGVRVWCYDAESGQRVFPRPGNDADAVLTDAQGGIKVSGLAPQSQISVVVMRPAGAAVANRGRAFTAAAIVPVTVPADRATSEQQIVFDERPAHLTVRINLPPGASYLFYAGAGGSMGTDPLAMPRRAGESAPKLRSEGAFIIDPLPTGKVRVLCRFSDKDGSTHVVTGDLVAKPEGRYSATVTAERIEIIEEQPATRSE